MSTVVLKVDVDTLRGTREGVPALVELFRRFDADATFLFSLGPDHTGRAIRRVLRPGFVGKVGRTSVTRHYGYRTLMYGTLLPGPDIGRRAGHVMRAVDQAGFETGVHTFDHVRWQDFVTRRDRRWTEREMNRAFAAYERVFGRPATVHGAAGWQMNDAALTYEHARGLSYASDTRGTHPFRAFVDGEVLKTLQLPTTLPTLDELIGRDGWTEQNVAEAVLEAFQARPADLHVYTLHAELEGMRLLPAMERLLGAWRDAGCRLASLRAAAADLSVDTLPIHEITRGGVPGRSGELASQGPAVAIP